MNSHSMSLCPIALNTLLLWSGLALGATAASAQDEPAEAVDQSELIVSGFIDSYYAYDFGDPGDSLRPGFLFNHTRHNEISNNIAMVSLRYGEDRVRGALGLMAGTYSEYNYAAELPQLRSIFEAWGGLRLARDVWWDVGIFPSHMGWESAISTLNPTLTRSMAAENSPYFLAGTRIYWTPTPRWSFGLTVANGWQNIVETNEGKGVGTQVVWKPNDLLTLNSSSWVSDEIAGEERLRLFHDLYGVLTLGEFSLIAGVDIGAQQAPEERADGWDIWWTTALIGRAQWQEWFATGVRAEYYQDPDQVIVFTGIDEGIQTFGASLNLDFLVDQTAMVRLEGRGFRDVHSIYEFDGEASPWNFALTASLAISFEKSIPGSP